MIDIPAHYLTRVEVVFVYVISPLLDAKLFAGDPTSALHLPKHIGISQRRRENLKLRMLENAKDFDEDKSGIKVLYECTKEDAERFDINSQLHMAVGIEMLYKKFNRYYSFDHTPGIKDGGINAEAKEQVENIPGIGDSIHEILVKQFVHVIVYGDFVEN